MAESAETGTRGGALGERAASVMDRRPLLIVLLFALLTATPGAWSLPPLDRDEARFAQATAQMLETGDFIAIRFQDDERNKKPAGIHWLQAASVAAFSDVAAREIWAYRLPSILGAVLAALLTYWIGASLFDRRSGVLAALLFASCLGVIGEATIAKTDAVLTATVVAAQGALAKLYLQVRQGGGGDWRWALAFWAAIGVSTLIKGPVG
ncbi:MAG: phospholipid carrier-dependent glycosyltransferase, partial [Pseudomonadota bacterium]